MKKDNEIFKEICEIAPTLSGIDKIKEFEIDNIYFENFNSSLKKKIIEKNNSKKERTLLKPTLRSPYFLAAASLSILFVLTILYYQLNYKPHKSTTIHLNWDYIIDNQIYVDNFDEKLLIDFFINGEVAPDDLNFKISDEAANDEELIKYIQVYEIINSEL